MDDDVTMALAVSFTDQSASFVHGFEAGRIDWRMTCGEEMIDGDGFPFHTANLPLFERLCAHHGYMMEVTGAGLGEYSTVVFTKKPKLRLVHSAG